MRTLTAPPSSVVDPVSRLPRRGSFAGPLPRVDLEPLGKGSVFRLAHRKKWIYVAIASEELFAAVAVIDLGYLRTTFALAYDAKAGKMIADESAIGHPRAGSVSDGVGEGFSATFRMGKVSVEVTRPVGVGQVEVEAEFPGLRLDARIDAKVKHPPLSAIGPIPRGVVNATEKHALLPASGELVVRGTRTRRTFDGALAGWDYTHGFLARHTQWRWAYLLGRAKTGERVGLNLVEGFLGDLECGVWVDDELFPLAEGRVSLDAARPMSPWHVRTMDGAVNLTLRPGGLHSEKKNFGIVRSRFLQPVGVYSGTIEVEGRTLELERALGVAEDQDVLW